MKVNTPSGRYLRPALLSDVEFIFECTRDWPGPNAHRSWTMEACRKLCESSVTNLSGVTFSIPMPDIPSCTMVLCAADDTPLAFINFAYHSGDTDTSGVDVISTATHPGVRGAGHFTALEDALGWLLNQHLQTGAAHYEALDAATTVLNRAAGKGGQALRVDAQKSMVKHTRAGYADAMRGAAGYSIE